MKKKPKIIVSSMASLLFRRRLPTNKANFIADASATAFALFEKNLPHKAINTYHIVHGQDEQKKPRYYWARVEVLCINEDGKLPARFCRDASGLLKPKYI